MTVFTTDANSVFSHSLSLTHTLSLSLRQLALFPFFPFEYLSIKMLVLRKNDY
jgi:hypothetical protein